MKVRSLICASLLLLAGCNMQQGGPGAGTPATTTAAPNPALDQQVAALDEAIRLTSNPVTKARSMFQKANALAIGNRGAAAVTAYDDLLLGTTDENIEVRRYRATSMMNRAQTLKGLKRHNEEAAGYADLLQRYAGETDLAIRRTYMTAVVYQAEYLIQNKRWDETVAQLRQASSQRCSDSDDLLQRQCTKASRLTGNALRELKRTDEAMVAYDEVPRRHALSTVSYLRDEVRLAYWSRALLLSSQGRNSEAIAAYDAAIALPAGPAETAARYSRVTCMYNRALLHERDGRKDAALNGYDQVTTEYYAEIDPSISLTVSRALVAKASVLMNTPARVAESLPALDQALQRLSARQGAQFDELRATAEANRGHAMLRLQRHDEAIAAFDAVIGKYGKSSANLREIAANAANSKARALELKQSRKRLQDILAEFDTLLQREQATPEPARSQNSIKILVAKALTQYGTGSHAEAIATYQMAITRYSNDTSAVMRQGVSAALYGKAMAQHGQGSSHEAARTLRDLIATYRGASESEVQANVKRAEQWLESNPQYDVIG